MHGDSQFVGERDNISGPNELICVDIFGPLPRSRGGVTSILVVCDLFSKFTRLYSMKHATSAIIIKDLEEYISKTPHPVKGILTDNGRQFTSDLWKKHWGEKQIKVKHTSPYHPAANPCERVMATIAELLRLCTHQNHTKWVVFLKEIEARINSVEHATTGAIPYLLMGLECPLNEMEKKYPEEFKRHTSRDVEKALETFLKNGERRKQRFEMDHNNSFKLGIGDVVYYRSKHKSDAIEGFTRKLAYTYEGPFVVTKLSNNSYQIKLCENPRIVKIAHISDLYLVGAAHAEMVKKRFRIEEIVGGDREIICRNGE